MKASELRIGNIVWFYNLIEPRREVVISPRWFKSSMADGDFEINNYWQPIPLTEEWLLRFGLSLIEGRTGKKYLVLNGFWHLVNDLYYQNGAVYIAEYWGENMHPITQTSVQYVHQLQNLYFALTGEELELKNP